MAAFFQRFDQLPIDHSHGNLIAHHGLVLRYCDDAGPLLMKPEFTEAVWCCTFHGLLGLHTLKSYLVVGSESGVFINFPIVDVTASVRSGCGVWNVTVRRDRDEAQAITCRIRLDGKDATAPGAPVFLRKPDWADRVLVADRAERVLGAPLEGGYLRLPVSPGPAGEVAVTFTFVPRVEDRRLHRVALDPQAVTRLRGVVLRNGPWVLLAPAASPRPAIVVSSRDVSLVLPAAGQDGFSVATAPRIEATDESLREALRSGARLTLAPWHQHRRDQNAALVFDMIALAESK